MYYQAAVQFTNWKEASTIIQCLYPAVTFTNPLLESTHANWKKVFVQCQVQYMYVSLHAVIQSSVFSCCTPYIPLNTNASTISQSVCQGVCHFVTPPPPPPGRYAYTVPTLDLRKPSGPHTICRLGSDPLHPMYRSSDFGKDSNTGIFILNRIEVCVWFRAYNKAWKPQGKVMKLSHH